MQQRSRHLFNHPCVTTAPTRISNYRPPRWRRRRRDELLQLSRLLRELLLGLLRELLKQLLELKRRELQLLLKRLLPESELRQRELLRLLEHYTLHGLHGVRCQGEREADLGQGMCVLKICGLTSRYTCTIRRRLGTGQGRALRTPLKMRRRRRLSQRGASVWGSSPRASCHYLCWQELSSIKNDLLCSSSIVMLNVPQYLHAQ